MLMATGIARSSATKMFIMETLEYHGSSFMFPMTYFSFPQLVLFLRLIFHFRELV